MAINVIKTRKFYHTISDASLCDCYYCCNYRAQVKSALPNVATYLDTLGIDIEKPFELSPLEPDKNNILKYCCCQYIVFGDCDYAYHHKIDDVKIRIATAYPNTGIKEKHFVLELFPIKLKLIA